MLTSIQRLSLKQLSGRLCVISSTLLIQKDCKQFLEDFGSDEDKDDNVDCSVCVTSETPAMSSPFARDPVRYDKTAHENWPRHLPGKALEITLDFGLTNVVFKKSFQLGDYENPLPLQ